LQYRFESYVFDCDRRELRRGAEVVPVEPQVFDLLEYLIDNRDRVVSKDDILAAVWHGRAVSESALTTRINAARNAIGDNGEDQRLIRTSRGKGFRFVGTVREERSLPEDTASVLAPELPREALTLPDRPSIAVLPFVNLSGDPEQEHFADGMSEDIITALSRVRQFFVIARNSTFQFKGSSSDVRQVANTLGVRYVVEGSVRKAGDRVRISAQLVDGITGGHVWAERFDRELSDIFAVQDEITQSIVGQIEPEMSRAEYERVKASAPENLSAWELFHRGMFHLYKRTFENNAEARRFFELAIAQDPNFSGPYGGISRTRSVDWLVGIRDFDPNVAVQMARQAIELDSRNSMSHLALGIAHILIHRDGESALSALEDGMKLNPNDAQMHNGMGMALLRLGRASEAVAHFQQAIRLSPSDPMMGIFSGRLAMAHLCLKDFDAAVEWGLKAAAKIHVHVERLALPAALAHLDRNMEAKRATEELLSQWPSLTLQFVRDTETAAHADYLATLIAGLRKAGLPEH